MSAWGVTPATVVRSCHAGLSALVTPIGRGRQQVGAVYASGFVSGDGRDAAEHAMRQRAVALGLEAPALEDEIGAVPSLSESDLAAVSALIEAMAEAIADAIASTANPLDEGGSLASSSRRFDRSLLVGESAEMRRLLDVLQRIMRSEATVLIQGENGTGKELVARTVHANSPRRGKAFLTQNCSALNDNLLDSELFGHRLGAFTGAVANKRGLFELADGGTLFLDEVGDMSPTMQVKLLRVLQEGTLVPVGDSVTRKVDVRIVAATNRPLDRMISDGSFREDLFYRINVISLQIPPLRERVGDIPHLITHFVESHERRSDSDTPTKRLSEGALDALMRYHWPGNVRELRHEIERLVVLSGDVVDIPASDIAPRILAAVDGNVGDGSSNMPAAVEALERRMIEEALNAHGGNKTRAAKELGVSRRNLIRKVKAYGFDTHTPRDESLP